MIIGIDLGTTNSLVGYFGADGPQLIPNAFGKFLTPSVVGVDDQGHILVGEAAMDRLVTHPNMTVETFKRWMGTDRETKLGNQSFRAEDLSAFILKSLVADAEAALGQTITHAVISVPAYFSEAQRKATKVAGKIAGLTVDRLINEPTAAALAYGLKAQNDGSHFLVFDLGGGTFDVTILEMFDGVMEVHASAGDNFLGGEDFLKALATRCFADFGINSEEVPPASMAQIKQKLERLKRTLSGTAPSTVTFQLQEQRYEWSITEPEFAKLCEPLVQRLRGPLERAVRDSGLAMADLQECIFVGGASRMPMCAKLVSRMFTRLPLRHVNPDEVIALGAAVVAGMQERREELREVVLTDVAAHSLGIETLRHIGPDRTEPGAFSPIIQRSSTVPVSRVESFTASADNQTAVKVKVYQGESMSTRNNVLLGTLDVKLPARKKASENEFEVRFTYDNSGLLQIDVKVLATGMTSQLLLQQNPGELSDTEIQEHLQRLQSLKIHPRDQQENIALLNRAERLYQEHLEARPWVAEQVNAFENLIRDQDARAIEKARAELASYLDSLESRDWFE